MRKNVCAHDELQHNNLVTRLTCSSAELHQVAGYTLKHTSMAKKIATFATPGITPLEQCHSRYGRVWKYQQ